MTFDKSYIGSNLQYVLAAKSKCKGKKCVYLADFFSGFLSFITEAIVLFHREIIRFFLGDRQQQPLSLLKGKGTPD